MKADSLSVIAAVTLAASFCHGPPMALLTKEAARGATWIPHEQFPVTAGNRRALIGGDSGAFWLRKNLNPFSPSL